MCIRDRLSLSEVVNLHWGAAEALVIRGQAGNLGLKTLSLRIVVRHQLSDLMLEGRNLSAFQ
eukprot:2174440-Alexandrium_andersonii.AAC.1